MRRLNQSVRGDLTGPLGPVSVCQVVEQAVQAGRPRWQDQAAAHGIAIEVITELEEDLPPIRGTDGELHDALLNLIFNAVDAMPAGGTITIRARALEKDVQLTVRDTGIGMDEETRRRVFEPFFTTKMNVGSGLGLSTVYGTVERWGGHIGVESAPGQGTTFILRLPAGPRSEIPESNIVQEAPAGRRGRLLIVEDDEDICRLLSRLLSTQHAVETAPSGRQAMQQFAPGRYDAVLIDLAMPEMPGDQVARQMVQADPLVVPVLITGWDLSADDPRLEVFDFRLQKPFGDLSEIRATVAQALAQHDGRTVPE